MADVARRPRDTSEDGIGEEPFTWSLPADFNIATDTCVQQRPQDPALIEGWAGGRRATFGELEQASARLSNVLAGLGVERGDRVGVILPQGLEVALAHLAIYRLGAVALPLSMLFGEEALLMRLGDSAARVVLVDSSLADLVGDLRDRLPAMAHVVAAGPSSNGAGSLSELSSRASDRFDSVRTRGEDPALLIYTSGTTGPPKGVLHAHRVLIGHLPGYERAHNDFPGPDSIGWTPADWAWIGGLMDSWLPCWHYGRPVVAHPASPFDPEFAIGVAREHDVTNAFIPPTAMRLMRRAGVTNGPRLRSILTGGEVLGQEMLEWSDEVFGVKANEIYGQTEVNLIVGNCSSVPIAPGSMGRPYPGHRVRVVDDAGQSCAPGVVGEIAVAADDPVAFLGYWNQSSATARKRRGGWIYTGDRAHADESGSLFFAGRDDDIINSGSYRIGPSEIETCLQRHPAIALSAVIGAPDELRGEIVKAFVVLRPGAEPSGALKQEIQQFVRQRLAAYEYPREIDFVCELPLTTTGKIRRNVLREQERARRATG